jgi:NADH-quinone oxidoreductase subunit L
MNQSLSVTMLLAIPLLPLVACLIAGFLGTAFGNNVIGRRWCHSVTILGVFISCVLSLIVLKQVAVDGAHFDATIYDWLTIGNLKMEVGFLIDPLAALMMCVVTFVSLAVHIYTIGYMHEDLGYNRFFSYISLFTFSMLMLCMSNNFLQLFFGWEAVGLVSYLLIGFWFTRDKAIKANLKAFMVNRVGDFGFIVGIALVYAYAGTLNYREVFEQAPRLAQIILPHTDWMLVSVMCICLFIGAMGKSAQFPLHVWLPDSMEGPTPISALIHAATMVTAGIYMVARMSPLFEFSDAALSFVLVIGAITALFMGIIGIVQNDIKRVVAYSTLSQLGYMAVGLGVSAYSAGIFHLMTHAFFKALLFLGAGSVIIQMHHNQDMRWMGGLRKYMPITTITFLIGSLALISTPFFSGFYSKDSIIDASAFSSLPGAGFAHVCVVAGVFVTALYTFRMYFMTFHGPERYDLNPELEHEHGHKGDKPRENPWVVTLPLVMLAIPSIVIGYFTIMPLLFGDYFGKSIVVHIAQHPAISYLRDEIHGPLSMALHSFTTLPLYLAIAGVAVAWYCYLINPKAPEKIKRFFGPLYTFTDRLFYLDWMWVTVFAGGSRLIGNIFWKGGDRGIIEGAVVNASWRFIGWGAGVTRWFQSGYLYHYALAMIMGVLILMSYFVWLAH